MLDMGFIHDVRKIVAMLPKERQTLLFSATMPPDIAGLAAASCDDPVRVEVTPVGLDRRAIEPARHVRRRAPTSAQLLSELLRDPAMTRVLVFTRTKHGANRVAEQLAAPAFSAEAIHGNKSQAPASARSRTSGPARSGCWSPPTSPPAASTSTAISHVINYELPNVPESYVHRIGRTARAGAAASAISFCDTEERAYLRDIERLIGQKVPVAVEHPFRAPAPAPQTQRSPQPARQRRQAAGAAPTSTMRPQQRPPRRSRQGPLRAATWRQPYDGVGGRKRRILMHESSHRAVATAALALLVAACASSDAAPATGDQLAAAGFVQRKADSPERIAALNSLPAHQFVLRNSNGSVKYLYADPIACDCIYVGGQHAYNQYREKMAGVLPADQLRAILSTAPLPGEEGL